MSEKRIAVVTGASRGIGRGICLELARSGFCIAGVATRVDSAQGQGGLAEVKERVEEIGSRFHPIAADIAALADHEKIENETLAAFGRIDLLVNNAGVAPRQRLDLLETTPESFDRVLRINLRGTFFLAQRIARLMVARKAKTRSPDPAIIFITSISAVFSSPERAEYCLSKAALAQAVSLFAARLAAEGVHVYEIRPGIIASDMTEPVREHYDRLIASGVVPLRRWGTPEDVGRAVAAVAGGCFPYSTGLVLDVDGGLSLRRL